MDEVVLIFSVVLSVVEVMLVVSGRRVSQAGSVTVEGRGASGVVSSAMV